MKTFLIKRDIAGAGKFTPEQLRKIAQKSCGVISKMGSQIEWIHSYVTENNLFCIYRAENEDLIREHGVLGGFPVNKIDEIVTKFSPATALETV